MGIEHLKVLKPPVTRMGAGALPRRRLSDFGNARIQFPLDRTAGGRVGAGRREGKDGTEGAPF